MTRTENVELLRSIGVDEVVDYTREDFIQRGQHYDVLLDLGASRSLADYRRVLAPKGTMLLIGAGQGEGLGAIWRVLGALVISPFTSQRLTTFLARGNREDLVVLANLVQARKLSAVIDRRYTLAEVPDAIRYVGTGKSRGKVVISVS